MGSAAVILGIFLAFSLSLSWVTGDREIERLEGTIQATATEKKDIKSEMATVKRRATADAEQIESLDVNLKKELAEKRRLERSLAFEQRQRRIAEERGEVTDLNAEIEKARAEAEAKAKQEISDLETKLSAVEEAKKRLGAEMLLQIEEEARKRAEAAWTQAELARASAQDAAEKNQEMRKTLTELEAAKQEIEGALKEHELARKEAEDKLSREQNIRTRLTERLKEAEKALITVKASGAELPEGAEVVETDATILIAELERERDEAVEELRKNDELATGLREEVKTLKTDGESVKKELESNKERLVLLRDQLRESKVKEEELMASLEEGKKAGGVDLQALIAEKDRQIRDYEQKVTDFEARLVEARRDQKTFEDQAASARSGYEELTARSTELEGKLKEAEERLSGIDTTGDVATALAARNAELEEKQNLIAGLELEIREARTERDAVKGTLEAGSQKLKTLEEELTASKHKEEELTAALAEHKDLARDRINTALKEKETIKEEYETKVAELEGRLLQARGDTTGVGGGVVAELEELRLRNTELTALNGPLHENWREKRASLAEAEASGEMAQELIAENKELQTKLKEAGLVNLQGKASTYVAKKMIDRNVELESQLKETQFQLARADAIASRNKELVTRLKEAEVTLSEYQNVSTTMESLNRKNAALESRIKEAEQALAQADAARFMLDELNTRNTELEEELARERAVGGGGDEAVEELKLARVELEEKLKKENEARAALEEKLREARTEKFAGEAALQEIKLAKEQTQEKLLHENKARTALEERLKEAAAARAEALENTERLTLAKKALEDRLADEAEKKKALETKLNEYEGADAGIHIPVPVSDLEGAVKEAEARLQEEIEKRRVVEARLREYEEKMEADRATIEGLRTEAEKSREEALGQDGRELREEIARVSREAAAEGITLPELQLEFARLKKKIQEKLTSGEVDAEDIVKLMEVEDVMSVYVIREGDTLWDISGSVYGDSFVWPLIYRYNLTRVDNPDIIEPDQILIVYKNITDREKLDARRKAMVRGDWRTWSDKDKRSWIEDWIR